MSAPDSLENLTSAVLSHLEETSPDHLEPMVRAAVRQALAEQDPADHFGKVAFFDRKKWRLQALLTSRTYDDIIFERTRRYRVEEVFLLQNDSHTLLSYASRHPSRHTNPKRIKYDLDRLLEDLQTQKNDTFQLPNKNTAIVRKGKDTLLIASIKGPPNEDTLTDLDYALTKIEKKLSQQNPDSLKTLQPHLESCLLIQSPK